jgi:hypothetical protein
MPEETLSTQPEGTPRLAKIVSVLHVAFLLVAVTITALWLQPDTLFRCEEPAVQSSSVDIGQTCSSGRTLNHGKLILLASLFGGIGSTLHASRYVVLAVRHRKYDPQRILWQLLSPIHGAILAVVAIYLLSGGLLSLARTPSPGDAYAYFVGGFSFIVGFSSEVFVKRLIRATEALFGEKHDDIEEDKRQADDDRNHPR